MESIRFVLVRLMCLFGAGIAAAQTPSWSPPAESARCPSKWGAFDERGSGNHMKPQTVLKAINLIIRTGEVIELAYPLNGSMPFFGTRRFDLHTKRTFINQSSNQRGSNEEVVISEIGQVGTSFDGFAHQTHGDSLYNCFKLDDIATRNGFKRLGIEKVGTFITRGILIDVAAYKGVEMLDSCMKSVSKTSRVRSKDSIRPSKQATPLSSILVGVGCSARITRNSSRPARELV